MLHQINSATASPCNGFCELDKIKKLCKGCFRTMSEIISWQNYTDEQKLEVLKKAQERKSQMKHN
jgi:predicted Fe-S protein YdhL (DUF1289 family)